MPNTSRTKVEIGDTKAVLHIPQLNLNGTSGEALMEECREAVAQLDLAINRVGRMTVHGRDWQTVADDSEYVKARAEQVARLDKLNDVKNEITAIYLAIWDQEN